MNAIAAKYKARAEAANSLLCVGLDPDLAHIPARFRDQSAPLFAFSRYIIDATAEFAAAFKPNSAFYEAHGAAGYAQLQQTCDYIHQQHPGIVTICDAKRGDNANTNAGYVTAIFDKLGCDAITLHAYLGQEALMPFLRRTDKACIILCRTSNAGARELQDLLIDSSGQPLWQVIAERVTQHWDNDGNCMLVVGATYPDEMRQLRAIAPRTTFLVPGLGTQGGDIAAVIDAGLDTSGAELIMSVSRAVLYADDPAAAARSFRDEINAARKATYAAR